MAENESKNVLFAKWGDRAAELGLGSTLAATPIAFADYLERMLELLHDEKVTALKLKRAGEVYLERLAARRAEASF